MELGLFLGSQQGIQTSVHVVRGNTGLHLSHCREIRPTSSEENWVSIPLEAANSGSL